MTVDADKYRLSEADHQAIFDQDIKPDLFAGAKPSNQPVAVIFGGQPGAGKSAAVDAAMRDLERHGGAVQIIGDDLRGYHPQYARLMEGDDKTAAFYTDRDTGKWVEKSIAEAKAQQVNIVIEGTMRDDNKVAETMQSLRAAGYQIDARALAVNERLSQQGIMQRYEEQKADRDTGRMTTPEAHKAAFDGMPGTLERIEIDKLADRVTVYRRGAEAIYSNELQAGEWVKEPKARETLEAERSRPMTLQERRSYAEGFDRLAELVARPERRASAEEVKKADELRQQAKQELAAEVFKQEPPAKAVQQNPELAPAYAYMRATEAKAEADGLNAEQRGIVMARVRENVAARIEQGDIPRVQIREERQINAEQQRDPER